MSKPQIEQLIRAALATLQLSVDIPAIQIETTKDKQHGDFASNIALILAKAAARKPRELAEQIVQSLPSSELIAKVEIAGPGFINFFLTADALHSVVADIIVAGDRYGQCDVGQQQRVLVEFVSSNPTGPLHVGHGRHAAFGDIVANLLTTVGYSVHREYYVNDAGRQMDILAVSVWLRYLALCNEKIIFPANGYQGDYVVEIAQCVLDQYGRDFSFAAEKVFANLPQDEPFGGDKELYIDAVIDRAKNLLGEKNYRALFSLSLEVILKTIHDDLEDYGVKFDSWFSEYDFTQTDVVDNMFITLKNKGLTYEKEGALWFRATDFNDEKDRVLQRSNGQRTYFANDLAYHVNKFERGFDLAIDIFGSDHHGYVPRMKAGLKALDVKEDKLEFIFLQFVSLYRGNMQVSMSTRSGSFVTLRELYQEVGKDAARFFYVMRKAEQHVDFDLELAKSKSNENPVYYIQYAHARICSVFRQLTEKNMQYDEKMGLVHVSLLTASHETALISTLSRYKEVILNAAKQREPHLLTHYMRDVANDFHAYYNSNQFLVNEENLRNARLALVTATRQVLVNGLKLLGVSTPESM